MMTPVPKGEAMTVETIDAPTCMLGEGPGYDPKTDTAWWFDILQSVMFERDMRDGTVSATLLPHMGSMRAAVDTERDIIAMNDGLYLRDKSSGVLSPHIGINAGMPSRMRTNDGRVHPSGALWISSMHHDAKPGAAAIHLVVKDKATLLFEGMTIPNSICFSPDGSAAYFADTREGVIYRVPADPETGHVTGERAVFHDGRTREGNLDGSVVDRDGVSWNARWGASEINAYSQNGVLLRSVAIPALQPSCPAFVGASGQGMLVTSAAVGLPLTDKDGRVFLIAEGFRGTIDPPFRLS